MIVKKTLTERKQNKKENTDDERKKSVKDKGVSKETSPTSPTSPRTAQGKNLHDPGDAVLGNRNYTA